MPLIIITTEINSFLGKPYFAPSNYDSFLQFSLLTTKFDTLHPELPIFYTLHPMLRVNR